MKSPRPAFCWKWTYRSVLRANYYYYYYYYYYNYYYYYAIFFYQSPLCQCVPMPLLVAQPLRTAGLFFPSLCLCANDLAEPLVDPV